MRGVGALPATRPTLPPRCAAVQGARHRMGLAIATPRPTPLPSHWSTRSQSRHNCTSSPRTQPAHRYGSRQVLQPWRALPSSEKESSKSAKPGKAEVSQVSEGAEPEEEVWGLLDFAAFNTKWDVPWGFGTLAFGMTLWLVSFVAVGLVLVPAAVKVLGFGDTSDLAKLGQLEKSELLVFNQVAETVVGLMAIFLVVGKYEFPDDVFKLSFSEPFKKPRGWAVWALWGILLAPMVEGLVASAIEAGHYSASGRGTVDEVVKLVDMDGSTYLSLFTVTGLLAPLLEETVFRGFLLTTLTKWMPVPVAVLISSVAFGLCHLSPKDLPQLISLGALLGFSYTRSRNLLTPMIIHGTWNSTVLTILYILASAGFSLEDLVNGTAPASEALLQTLIHSL